MSVARHTAYNFVGAVVPLAVLLVTVPLYLEVIGLERYGILAICWLLVGYFNLFDFGLGKATAQKIATLADAPPDERNRVFWTSGLMSLLLALIAALAFLPLAALALPMMTGNDPALLGEVTAALPLLVAAIPLAIFQSLFKGALEGRREFLKINAVLAFGTIATGVLPLLAAYLVDIRLQVLILVTLLCRAAVVLLLVAACVPTVPLGRPRLSSASEFRGLLRFGGWTTITNVVGPVMIYFDRFAIGAILGAAAVALYVVPFNLVSQLAVLPAAFATALFPRIAGADATEERLLGEESLRLLACVLTPATLVMAALLGPFLMLWLGKETGAAAAPVGHVLLFGLWANSLARIAIARLQARGRPDLPAAAHLAEAIPYLLLLYASMSLFGLVGAALAWSARAVADAVILGWLNKLDRGVFALLARQAGLVLAAILIGLAIPHSEAVYWIAFAILGAVAAMLLVRDSAGQIRTIFDLLPSRRRLERSP